MSAGAPGLCLACADLIRLDADHPFDGLHLALHEQNIGNLDRLFVGPADCERQVAGAQAQNDVIQAPTRAPLLHLIVTSMQNAEEVQNDDNPNRHASEPKNKITAHYVAPYVGENQASG